MSENKIKQSIKYAALELFNSKGFDATVIRDISAKADCSLPMMYYYYESKEKLLHEIVAVDFVNIMNAVFSKAIKTNNLRLFATSFITDIMNLNIYEKQTLQIALKLHMGLPKREELNRIILAYKFSKENELKNLLLATWRSDKNIEIKTNLVLDVLYRAMICVLLTNRPVSIKQVESDIIFLL